MKSAVRWLIAGAIGCSAVGAMAQTPPEVTLTRLDCGGSGTPSNVARFSDTYAYEGKMLQLVASCYLIKHGEEYMVWDAGYPTTAAPNAPPNAPIAKVSIVDQLKQLNLTPAQIKFLGISHYHGDHIGQAGSLPQATLLIGQGDWNALTAEKPAQGVNPAPVANWVSGGGKVEPVPRDKDVFGDGTVVMLDMPGHTPGHHSLLVKLKDKGNVLLSGDLAHFHENYESNGVPPFNFDRAQTIASIERMKQIVGNVKATVIIQHDMRDIAKLPAFPAAAK